MSTFDTPAPIRARVRQHAGSLRAVASPSEHTTVTVTPSRPDRPGDVEAAQRTRVTLVDGVLDVTVPRDRGLGAIWRPASVDVLLELPCDSHLDAETAAGDLEASGRLADCRLKTSAGNVRVEEATRAHLRTSAGNVDARRVSEEADLSTSAGNVGLGEGSGHTTLRAGSGDITVGRSAGRLDARTAYGQMRVDSVREGALSLATGYGTIDIGVLDGTAAKLDVSSEHGHVRSELQPAADGPGEAEPTASITAVTRYGNVTIRRALS
ncbi:DUF4097 family beta strand repeat-containing protein [Knoellia aerolata]|uniref:DUF4097 family beta strand repeat-containing protein n=1 Tax=Knoellia aerolata TaxID=442954 RepID=UPI00055DCF9D|nr:DUF4097 family beta strand repeat-containing protein [Knoellia aerolata]